MSPKVCVDVLLGYVCRMSLKSRSPEDSSSLLSASAGSLDSMLNQSREEEEIRVIMDHSADNDSLVMNNDISDIAGKYFSSSRHFSQSEASISAHITH